MKPTFGKGLFTPRNPDGDRLSMTVVDSGPGWVVDEHGTSYQWIRAACGLGCKCDAIAWEVES